MGELRVRRRVALPLVVGLGGMVVPIGIYLALNAGRASAAGGGTAMSTDTAFALGLLALVGGRAPDRVSTYLLTFAIVDDVAGIVIIALAYSSQVELAALGVGLAVLGVGLAVLGVGLAVLGLAAAARARGVRNGAIDLILGLAAWTAFFESGVDPVLVGLVIGMLAVAYPATRSDLARAFTSPVTLGILAGYVLWKPAGTVGAAWLLAKASRGRIRPPVGWAAVGGVGAIAGIGFIVSLLIASLAFRGTELAEAKVGILSAAVCASTLTWLVFRLTAMLPKRMRLRALLGTAETVIDLAVPVDSKRDHVRGPDHAPVTLVEFGDFECPYCGQAEPAIRELLAGYGDLRYVWRHLPLSDVHPHARLAAEPRKPPPSRESSSRCTIGCSATRAS
jgi:Na+/H+ antiporter NhaA